MPEEQRTISRYRLDRKIGEGGMGEVYLAHDTTLGRSVALKILPPSLASQPERLNRFIQEAMLASALSHPNVAHIYEMSQADGVWFITMEYVEGEPLSARIERGPLPVKDIVRIGIDVSDVLDAAHTKGIIHRDIKPANLMIDSRGRVKVLDFGLAKKEGGFDGGAVTQLLTGAGMVLGTVRYMSPEQALGKELDHRTDLFSLGIVFYEMATARPPFAGATAQETVHRLLQSQPEALARFNYEIPVELDRIVKKCLEKDRESRYQSARDLLTDLRNLDRDSQDAHDFAAAPGSLQPRQAIGVIIVDDEELARGLLREYLDSTEGVQILAECANGFEAVKAIAEHKPDLVFLDVQMPKLDGFEVLELIGREIPVIFVTAYDQYAMRAFDAHAVDYLLKPFSADRFQKAVERARQRLGQKVQPLTVGGTELAAAARPPQQYAERIVVKDGTKVHIIPVDRLDYAEAQDDYVSLNSQGKSYLKQQTISSLETTLDPRRFIRIHRSYLINFERVSRIEPYSKDSRVVVLSDGKQLPVSRAGFERLKALLDEKTP